MANGQAAPSEGGPAEALREDMMALVFELRHTMTKKYNTAMCHGSRLICDHDVYDKKF